ncbi:hypothetical protein [Echinicola sp. 20G]|uniref:hypothetical protein n=1 Tax=Echinicola sp. 20G TaxID=2781961 RepID=UPI0019105A72|nr:hypothetical protein [Echinicola sp. 20G]
MKHLFSIMIFAVVMTSCKDDEMRPSLDNLSGMYERAIRSEDQEYWYIYGLVFNKDGNFEQRITIRETEHGEDLGYASLVLGNFSVKGENLTWELQEFYHWPYQEQAQPYGQRNDLIPQDETNSFSQSGTIKLLDQGHVLSISFPCNDVLSSCIGEMIYKRVK